MLLLFNVNRHIIRNKQIFEMFLSQNDERNIEKNRITRVCLVKNVIMSIDNSCKFGRIGGEILY